MKRLILALALLFIPATVMAQTNPVPAGQAFQVQFDHDGTGSPTGFQCFVDGKPTGSALPATGRICAIPGQTAGTHVVTVSAINAFGSSLSSGLTSTAGTPPNAPTNLRIVIQVAVQQDGGVNLLAAAVSREP